MSEFRSIIGVRNIHFAEKLEGLTWGAPIRVMGLQEIAIKNVYAEGSLYGDMVRLKHKKRKTGLDVTCSVAEYTTSVKAMLEGGAVTNGEYVNSADNMGNNIALLFEQVYDDGSSVFNVVYNTSLSADNLVEGKGNSENMEFATTSLSGSAVAIEHDGEQIFNLEIDTLGENVDQTKITNFFKEVQLPGVKAA
ncbi:major tail protein [Clostridium butyricum]|uniref:Phage major tail protein, Phi13 family n=1 Tax=Clostridium butyricum E4 str. BoNT E BL5262 TaxID=632245 RepID=C4IGZ5_CLOBU|nr:major tail protein [Clostridium butyricum]EEP52992.1 phage major tail protein, Phi13 family [Clostridium butyricum E4 str. BoNT E BL5262]NFL30558.1 phage tail protein [Clostridium butyricum]NFS19513.1 phage tail protein [Clostridium butyricum]